LVFGTEVTILVTLWLELADAADKLARDDRQSSEVAKRRLSAINLLKTREAFLIVKGDAVSATLLLQSGGCARG
jgi:hypothetical protein